MNIWQIDSFEGGKGSRADFLQRIGNSFAETENCYINVISLSADAARENLAKGVIPDIISYGAGEYGFESYVVSYEVWCSGGYCLLTLDKNSDFSDVNGSNTVVNEGKDNLVLAASLLYGLIDAKTEKSTTAYVSLINGKAKYLFGTQRDIYRLNTRGAEFAVKAVTVFNDLYQNVSITSASENKGCARKYIDYLLTKKNELHKIGMMFEGETLYENEMAELENVKYDYRLKSPLSTEAREEIKNAVFAKDVNKLKKLLN